MKVQSCIFIFAVLCYPGLGAHLPSNFQKCNHDDVFKGDCFKLVLQDALPKLKNGIPDLKLLEVDPLLIESVTIGEGKGAVRVVQNLKNFKIFGISSSIVEIADLQLELDKKTFAIHIKTHSDYRYEADYKLDGHVLLLPAVGEGTCNVSLPKMKLELLLTGELLEKDYLKVTEAKLTLDPELIIFKFENLFNGDKALGDQINNLLNDNWKEVFSDTKESYEQAIGAAFLNVANNIFTKIPFNELFPK